jgi:hypothetical protein
MLFVLCSIQTKCFGPMSAIIRSGDLWRFLYVSRGSTVLIHVEIVCIRTTLLHNFVKLASSWFSSEVRNLCSKLHFYLWHITVEYKIWILLRIIHIIYFLVALRPNGGHGLLILEVSRLHTTMHHSRWDSSERVISSSQTHLYMTTYNTHNR